jgi:hypothetical protein
VNISLGTFHLTRFAEKDIEALHRIRNHATVRKYMANTQPIGYDSHVKWVRQNLIGEKKLLLFMVRRKDRPLGFTLLKKISEDTAEMGVIFRDASKHPVVPYYATVITLYIAFGYLKLSWLVSYVIPGHERAISMNHSFGGWEVESDKPGMIKFRVSRDVCTKSENYQKVIGRIKNDLTITPGDLSPFGLSANYPD